MKPGFELDHVGVAVKALEHSLGLYRKMGWETFDIEEVPSERVRVAFVRMKNQCSIELLESTHDQGPIARFIDKRGEGVHHICYRVQDLRRTLADLKREGVRLINEEPRPGAHGCWVAFVHPSSCSGVLIELSESSSVLSVLAHGSGTHRSE